MTWHVAWRPSRSRSKVKARRRVVRFKRCAHGSFYSLCDDRCGQNAIGQPAPDEMTDAVGIGRVEKRWRRGCEVGCAGRFKSRVEKANHKAADSREMYK